MTTPLCTLDMVQRQASATKNSPTPLWDERPKAFPRSRNTPQGNLRLGQPGQLNRTVVVSQMHLRAIRIIYRKRHLDSMKKSEEEWKKQLDTETYQVLRKKATERPFTGKYLHNKEKGMYVCAGCGAPLFSSDTKFDSGTGWPSFWSPAEKENIEEKSDRSLLMKRVEILCKQCGGHLGHVFEDGPQPTGLRYCVNSLSLNLKKTDDKIASADPKE